MRVQGVQIMLSLIVSLGFFFCLYYLLNRDIPANNKEVLYTMLGSLGTVWVLQMNYFFGSTQSSKEKDSQLTQIALNTPVHAKDMNVQAEGDVNVSRN